MKKFGKLLLMSLNILCVLAMFLSAYSPSLFDPQTHPYWSLVCYALPGAFIANVAFIVLWIIFKWQYIFLSLIAIACCAAPLRSCCPLNFKSEASVSPSAIKVLSYNVLAFGWLLKDDTPNLNPVLDYIKELDADIVCLQEYVASKALREHYIMEEDVIALLSQYPYHSFSTQHTHDNFATGLVTFSKYPILSEKTIAFPNSSANRATLCELQIGNEVVAVVNVHLASNKLDDHDKQLYAKLLEQPEETNIKESSKLLITKLAHATVARAKQVELVNEAISNAGRKKTIICGDFNDIPVSYAHHKLQGDGSDAHTQAGTGLGISYNQNKFYFRIDNILYRGDMKATYCKVDNSIADSDHYPIYAYIEF